MNVFLSRQPILDVHREVVAYELLYRGRPENRQNPDGDANAATSQILQSAVLGPAFAHVSRGVPVFVNFPRELLLANVHELFPPEAVVIEILETVHADGAVIDACRDLKQRGYTIALDDFEERPDLEPLIELADIVKVDFVASTSDRRAEIARDYRKRCRLLAEKIESWDDYEQARWLGYELFQGYYFCEPQMVTSKDMPGSKLGRLRFVEAVSREDIDFDQLEVIVQADPSLMVRLLRILNSPLVGAQQPLGSVRQALVVLGERRLRRWGTLVAMSGLIEEKPRALLNTALTRAKFSESVGGEVCDELNGFELFLLGLLSLVDALVDTDRAHALSTLAVADAIRLPLLGTGVGRPMQLLQLVEAYERGEWDRVERLGSELGTSPVKLSELYAESLRWADTVTAEVL